MGRKVLCEAGTVPVYTRIEFGENVERRRDGRVKNLALCECDCFGLGTRGSILGATIEVRGYPGGTRQEIKAWVCR